MRMAMVGALIVALGLALSVHLNDCTPTGVRVGDVQVARAGRATGGRQPSCYKYQDYECEYWGDGYHCSNNDCVPPPGSPNPTVCSWTSTDSEYVPIIEVWKHCVDALPQEDGLDYDAPKEYWCNSRYFCETICRGSVFQGWQCMNDFIRNDIDYHVGCQLDGEPCQGPGPGPGG